MVRGVFAGAGSDGLNVPEIAQAIIQLTGKVASEINVLYFGTATYDLPGPQARQTARFVESGCTVTTCKVADEAPSLAELEELVKKADVLLVSGGNTLFAMDRWKKLGVDRLMRDAMERNAVLAGGSAGAICWFDAGHSDSADPDSFKEAMLAASSTEGDESSTAPQSAAEARSWEYIRVPCLGFLPGLVCPHHDKTQSNGVLRASDFDAMLLRHSGERGIGIDHWAALVVDGDRYSVISLAGMEGSVLNGAFSPERKGQPGIWIKDVVEGAVQASLVPSQGRVADLLRPAHAVVPDARVDSVRVLNPA
eukprot:CAMPEP_0114542180 /NCGR_PEP_ID=MMETSP0114-20121206/1703_1 /TAXON_ID=31324 /ORGANISM="Goniomonas sp, Strain m" /LENGTH=308 /DNA_ID=CAMNT_0001726471 /DNA_START=64 /DNA_END=990 /DNA_ORIENTATION=+